MENKINELVPEKSKFKEFIENGWDLIKFAVLALIIVIPIRLWIAQPFVVSGDSMYPTFHDGEYLIVDEISYIMGNAHRGEVVIFKYPNDTKRFFIKRVVGLPNEKIIIKEDSVTIINKENPLGFKLSEPYLNEKIFGPTGEYTTKDNEYFVMGDNRNKSSDSRFWGVLPEKLMVGKAFLRLLPLKTVSYLPGNYNQ